MEPIHKRIIELREHLGLNQSQFAKEIGVTSQLVNMIESGKSKFKEKNIRLVCLAFGVNEEWLRHGTGEMLDDEAALSERERRLLALFRGMSPTAQEFYISSVESMVKLQEEQKGEKKPIT